MEFNICQSVVEGFSKYDPEIKNEFLEIIEQIELVSNMTSPDRRYAKDMPLDKLGRVIVDLENPHILENMSYFTQPASCYKENEVFTESFPNSHPNSEYRKFWKEQADRCRKGCIRDDGEWITGYHYFYLNFSPILLTEDHEDKGVVEKSTHVRADRVEDFPRLWDGDYLYFHYIEKGEEAGKYGTVLKTRGRGFSFKGGSMTGRNQLLVKKSRTFMMASETEYLNKDGIWNKYNDVIDFMAVNSPLPSSRIKNDQNKMHITLGYEDSKSRVPRGMKSEAFGVTLKDNPQKARGKRGMLIQWEEAGKFPHLLTAWSIARMSLEDGRSVFGYMVAFGTGGTEGADFLALEALFYNPRGYRVYPMRNVFDKVRGKGECAFFFPEYLNRKNCYDKDGNSDITKALLEILEDRLEIKRGSFDPHALTQEKADRPITPQEAVMRKEGSFFPVEGLKDYLSDISPNLESFTGEHYIGNIQITETGTKFDPITDKQPLREFPIKDNLNKEGCPELFEPPVHDRFGEIIANRYIAAADTYDDDHSTTNSLGSIFVFDLFTDRIVAEYTGRPQTANEYYSICAALTMHYNAKLMYENDKKGMYGWFFNNKLDYLLEDNPQILKDMDLIKGEMHGNKLKGVNSSKPINKLGRRLGADWMREMSHQSLSASIMNEEEISDEAKELVETEEKEAVIIVPNYRTIRSIGLIKEAIAWNEDGNFDRISAFGILMISRLNRLRYIDGVKESASEDDDLYNDPFFARNYDGASQTKDYFSDIINRKRNNNKIQSIYKDENDNLSDNILGETF